MIDSNKTEKAGSKLEIVIFDFDGVIIESVDIKTDAFTELFKDYPNDIVEKMVRYHKENLGMSRYEKFRYYYREFIREELTKEREKELGKRFSDLVLEKVIACPYVKGSLGSLQAIQRNGIPIYLATGTPQEEIETIVERRGLKNYFKAVYGAPAEKADIIRKVINGNMADENSVIMVGDAMTDYNAALKAGVRFVGIAPKDSGKFPTGTTVFQDLEQFQEYLEDHGF